jgi:hypothetical protein
VPMISLKLRLYQNHPVFLPKSPKIRPLRRRLHGVPARGSACHERHKSVDPAEPCQAGPIEKGVTQVIAPDEHSPATGGGLRQNKSISKWQANTALSCFKN